MALPTKNELWTLDYAFLGEPFCDGPAPDLALGTLDYAFLGEPFLTNSETRVNSHLKTAGGIARGHLKSIGGIAEGNLKMFLGINNRG